VISDSFDTRQNAKPWVTRSLQPEASIPSGSSQPVEIISGGSAAELPTSGAGSRVNNTEADRANKRDFPASYNESLSLRAEQAVSGDSEASELSTDFDTGSATITERSTESKNGGDFGVDGSQKPSTKKRGRSNSLSAEEEFL